MEQKPRSSGGRVPSGTRDRGHPQLEGPTISLEGTCGHGDTTLWAGGDPGQACARPLDTPPWRPLPLPLSPAARVKTPRGRLLRGAQGAWAGPSGASGRGPPRPSPHG